MPGRPAMTAGPRRGGRGSCSVWTGPGPLMPSGVGDLCCPGCYAGRGRGRALGRRAAAAGPGRVGERCWVRAGGVGPGHRSADPGRGGTYPAAATGPVARAEPEGRTAAGMRTSQRPAMVGWRHCQDYHWHLNCIRRAGGPAPPAAADGARARDRHRSPGRSVYCPADGQGRAAAQAHQARPGNRGRSLPGNRLHPRRRPRGRCPPGACGARPGHPGRRPPRQRRLSKRDRRASPALQRQPPEGLPSGHARPHAPAMRSVRQRPALAAWRAYPGSGLPGSQTARRRPGHAGITARPILRRDAARHDPAGRETITWHLREAWSRATDSS